MNRSATIASLATLLTFASLHAVGHAANQHLSTEWNRVFRGEWDVCFPNNEEDRVTIGWDGSIDGFFWRGKCSTGVMQYEGTTIHVAVFVKSCGRLTGALSQPTTFTGDLTWSQGKSEVVGSPKIIREEMGQRKVKTIRVDFGSSAMTMTRLTSQPSYMAERLVEPSSSDAYKAVKKMVGRRVIVTGLFCDGPSTIWGYGGGEITVLQHGVGNEYLMAGTVKIYNRELLAGEIVHGITNGPGPHPQLILKDKVVLVAARNQYVGSLTEILIEPRFLLLRADANPKPFMLLLACQR